MDDMLVLVVGRRPGEAFTPGTVESLGPAAWPAYRDAAAEDEDLAPLRSDLRFQASVMR